MRGEEVLERGSVKRPKVGGGHERIARKLPEGCAVGVEIIWKKV